MCLSLVNHFKGFDNESVNKDKHSCVKLVNYLNLDIDEGGVNELLKIHDQEWSNEDLVLAHQLAQLGQWAMKQMGTDGHDKAVDTKNGKCFWISGECNGWVWRKDPTTQCF